MKDLVELLGHMTPGEIEKVHALIRSAPVWVPFDGPQLAAYTSEADEIGYGGAAGGGKTDLAIGFALTEHQVSAIFRKNGTEHTAIIDRISEIIGTREGFNGSTGIWRIADKQIELCSVPNLGDEKKYQGRPHDLLVLDEATNIPFLQIMFLKTWLRPARTASGKTVRQRVLYTFNPPTSVEGRWVLEYFAPWLDKKHPRPAAPGELRWFATVGGKDTEVRNGKPFVHGGETIYPKSRTFIPARVTDNPTYSHSGYMATLQSLPEPLRSQMLYGDFNAGMTDDPWQVIPTQWVERAMERWSKPTRLPPMTGVGVDVARGGRDATVIARKHEGLWFDEPIKHPGCETPDGATTAGLVVAARRDSAPVMIDVIGVGSSPYDYLKDLRVQVLGVNVGEKSFALDQAGALGFFNLRSELVWKFRELLDPVNNTGVALPPSKELLADLCAFTWKPQGRAIRVLGRDEIVAALGRSPDVGSAYILAAMDVPKRQQVGVQAQDRRKHNPFDSDKLLNRR